MPNITMSAPFVEAVMGEKCFWGGMFISETVYQCWNGGRVVTWYKWYHMPDAVFLNECALLKHNHHPNACV